MKKLIFSLIPLLIIVFIISCKGPDIIDPEDNFLTEKAKGGDVILSDDMHVAPYRIILNAQGNDQTIQIIFGGYIPSGYRISDFDIDLYFDNVKVAEAIEFTYCYVDQNFLGDFDRETIQNNDYVKSCAGSTVTVTATGEYTLTNSDGDAINREFTKYGSALIVKPGKK